MFLGLSALLVIYNIGGFRMSFFSSIFKKSVGAGTATEESNQHTDEKISKLYGQLFNQFSDDINSFQFQTEINQVLLTKRQRVANSEEYINILISNVTYFIETEKAVLKIIKEVFESKALPNYNNLEEKVFNAQNLIKQKMPEYSAESKQVYNEKYKTNNQKVEALQFDYAYHSLINNWTIDMIGVLSNNPDFVKQLFAGSADSNIETLKKYLQLHANAKLENITFKSL